MTNNIIYTKRIIEAYIVDMGVYNGFRYIITHNGNNPCAYIDIPEGHRLFVIVNGAINFKDKTKSVYVDSEEFQYLAENICVHGGITFVGDKVLNNKGHWIGWDYAHYPMDYSGLMQSGNIIWTTEMIKEEIMEFIDSELLN